MPLLRDAERPPPDVVRSTLRKFESAPTRRAAPAARVSAVLRGFEGQRTSTPEPRDGTELPLPLSPRTPSPSPLPPTELGAAALGPEGAGVRPVSRAALEGIARAGSTVLYAFEAPRVGSHLPPLAAANPVLVGRARRIGVIRPMPARVADEATIDDAARKSPEPTTRLASPSPSPPEPEPVIPGRTERKDPPPAALVEPIPRTPPEVLPDSPPPGTGVDREPSPEPKTKQRTEATLVNGHEVPERAGAGRGSRIGAAGIERAWSGSGSGSGQRAAAPWAGGPRRARAPAPAATSIVFNFCDRKEVPDYIENDGIILRANRKNRIKAGEPGVVVLRPEALARADSDSEMEEVDCGPPSPCSVRFVNDNVLINGRSSMPHMPNRDRIAKLKLQFDDSLTRTFEYPSETSLCEEQTPGAGGAQDASSALAAASALAPAPASALSSALSPASSPQLAESPLHATLAANTHMASAALSSYTPSKTRAGAFQLGVTRHRAPDQVKRAESPCAEADADAGAGADADAGAGAGAGACGALAARSWSEARTHATDLLF